MLLRKLLIALFLFLVVNSAQADGSIVLGRTRAGTDLSGSLAFGSLSIITYTAVVTNSLSKQAVMVDCYNSTNADIFISRNASTVSSVIPSGQGKILPYGQIGLDWRTDLSAKAVSAPSSGALYCTLSY